MWLANDAGKIKRFVKKYAFYFQIFGIRIIQGIFKSAALKFLITPSIFNFFSFWKVLRKANEMGNLIVYID